MPETPDSIDGFIARLAAVYGTPTTPDPPAFKAAVRDALAGFDAEVIDALRLRLVREWTKAKWPLPAELRAFAGQEANRLHAERRTAEHMAKQARDPWSDESIREADRMILCDLGYEAAQDGWIIPLHGHFRETGAWPDAGEISKLKRAGLKLQNNIARSRKLPVASLGRAFEQRERDLRQRIDSWAEAEALRHHPMAAG